MRPQWTARTVAGRAKLAVDGDNWEWAERTRKLRTQREAYCGQWQHHVRAKNSYEAALARQERLSSLRSVRDEHRQGIDERGKVGKGESELIRQKHHLQRRQWEAYGKDLHHVHNNAAARREKVMLHEERGSNSERMRRERERHERQRAVEITERAINNRERAERVRRENVQAVRSVSAAELRSRRATYDEMRQAEVVREGHREHERAVALSEAAWKRDAVHHVSSREMVAEFNALERQRKAAHAAQVRQQMHRLRHSRMRDVLGEAERKRALHDEVVRERTDGPLGSYHYHQTDYPQQLLGPATRSGLGFELEEIKRVNGGSYGYSTDEGRPSSPPRHAHSPPEHTPPPHYHDPPEHRDETPPHYLNGGVDDGHTSRRRHGNNPYGGAERASRHHTPPPHGRHVNGYLEYARRYEDGPQPQTFHAGYESA